MKFKQINFYVQLDRNNCIHLYCTRFEQVTKFSTENEFSATETTTIWNYFENRHTNFTLPPDGTECGIDRVRNES